MEDIAVPFVEVHYVSIQKIGNVPVTKGDFQSLPPKIQAWLAQMVRSSNDMEQRSMFISLFSSCVCNRSNCVLHALYTSVMGRMKKLGW